MTLDEAIKHCEEVADRFTEQGKCAECAAEHRQLADWLKELKDYKERIPSYEAGYNDAKREIALSGEYERAYERGKADAQTERWIPVSERLPEEYEMVIVSDIFDIYIGEFVDAEENWGGKHFINEHGMHSKTVTAWMPLPKPYGIESEDKE